MAGRAIVLSLLLLCGAGSAWANGRYPSAGLIAAHPSDPQWMAVRTTFGLVVSGDGGKTWQWVCESVAGMSGQSESGGTDPFIVFAGTGALVVAGDTGLRVAAPGLCAWTAVADPLFAGNLPAIDLARDPQKPNRVVALTMQNAVQPVLVETLDAGAHWQVFGKPLAAGATPRTLDIATGGRIYVTLGSAAAGKPDELWRTDDNGGNWQTLPFAPTPSNAAAPLEAYIGAIAPANPQRIFVRAKAGEHHQVWQSDDGGAQWTLRFDAAGLLAGFALAPDGGTLAVGGPAPHAGVWTAAADGGAFAKAGDFGARCLTWTATGLFACGDEYADKATVAVSQDGGKTFAGMYHLPQVKPIVCAGNAVVTDACDLAWPKTAKQLGAKLYDEPTPTTVKTPPGKAGGFCQSTASGDATTAVCLGLALLLIVAVPRRRTAA